MRRSTVFLVLWLVACDDPRARPPAGDRTMPGDGPVVPELLPYDPPRPATPATHSIDSAGVTLVHNNGPGAWSSELLRPDELVRLDPFAGEPGSEPRRITAVWIGTDGTLYVALGERGLRVFGPLGQPLFRVGVRPTGPAAFESILLAWVRADSLFVYDPQLRRITLLTMAGAHVGSWDDPRRANGLVVPVGPTPAGWLAEVQPPRVRPQVPAGEPFEPPPRRLHRFTPGADTVGPVVFEIARPTRYGALDVVGELEPALFEAQPYWGLDAAGRLFVTSTSAYVIDVYDPSGRLARRIARGHRPVAIPATAVEDARRMVIAYFDTLSAPGPPLRHAWLERLENGTRLPVPPAMPPLGRLHVATDGALWVERLDDVPAARYLFESLLGSTDERRSRWDVFAADGRFLGTAELPRGFAPLRVLGDRVAGVLRRSGRADQLIVFRVRAPARAASSADPD